MNMRSRAWTRIWKIPAVIVATVIGCIAASQVGWSMAAELAKGADQPLIDIDHLFAISSGVLCAAILYSIYKFAKAALWVTGTLMLYSAIVLGAWDGFASGFDPTYGEIVRHHYANTYAMRHITAKHLAEVCGDKRIQLSADGKASCPEKSEKGTH